MVPGLDLQLRVVIKALHDVVAPALDPANQLAQEQLGLSLATLAFVQSRLPYLHAGSRQQLANAVALATAVADAAQTAKFGAQIASAQALLDDPGSSFPDLEGMRGKLLDAVSAVVEQTPSPHRTAVAKAVIAASKPQFDLARAWSLPAGFELNPEEVPALETLL